ncbi:MAG TPA: tRNA pseudouridine(38-40) synthase TruA [Clostridia bacterium]|jgi:tRNA pseudouridine38-40 synthase|nr:tRNA pseudouridine(38-40) synthase TruA [Clostridia bacterium]HHY06200.1 tRNA pseudouridine(38-40) synthase TruA [Clostridia bacterium]
MRNFKLVVAYEGTNYHGFQIQKGTGLPTIQGVLEKALSTLTKEEIKVIGAGRTDAGVHAKGQVVNFYSQTKIPIEKLPLALNSLLPRDIAVLETKVVPPDFHASFNARSKTYSYLFYNDRIRDPFWQRYAYHIPVPLKSIREMERACQIFQGEHNFRGFCASETKAKRFTRTIYACSLEKVEKIIKLQVTGNGFLYNMVRIMGGTILEVGQGKRKAEEIASLLENGDRTLAGMTLPPQGLYLLSVEYD